MIMQTMTFNQAQREIINMMSCLNTDKDVADLKNVLVHFLNDRMQQKIEQLWERGILSEEKMNSYKEEHLRTSY